MCKSEYKLTRKMQWDGDVLKVQDTIHDVLREAKQAAEDAMTGAVLSHFECDFSDFREYMHDKIKWEQKQWAAMPKWIPVTERLPEEKISPMTMDYTEYPCVFDGRSGQREVRYYKFGKGHFWHGSGCIDEYVTHWAEPMPLPEPPKEADDGNK